MATENECKGLRVLDPVEGLIDYINAVKPFHTKIVEVLVEYVYGELVDTSVIDNLAFGIDMTRPFEDPFAAQCQGGYSAVPWGGPRGWPILSPNQNIAFEDYPAVDPATRTIILPGDRSQDLDQGDSFELISHIDDTTGLCEMVDIGLNHFIIEDTSIHAVLFTTEFSVGEVAYTSGVPQDDERGFTISAIFPDTPSPGLVRVEVDQNVLNDVPIGHFGLRKLSGDNTGVFTVSDIEYSEGSNDFYLTPLVESSRRMGDDPHTIITTVEPLNPLTILGTNQSHGMQMRLASIEINKVLSYSNIANLPSNTPDEGYVTRDIVDVTISTLDGFGLPIPDTGKFVVPGNLSESNIFVDEWVRVQNSSGNNGIYTIASLVYSSLDDETTIGVNEHVRDMTADGTARIDVPANMFYVNGDHSNRFRQGVGFNIVGGTYQGSYMTLYSDFVNGKTRIRPAEEIINVGKGYSVADIPSSNEVTIDRNKTALFIPGSNLNIVNSSVNDGMYTVVSALYDLPSDTTTITVVEDILESTVDGEVFFSAMGFIKEQGLGYGEGTDFCDYHPETQVTVRFDEELEIEGITLTLHNDLIAYNLENSDWWGLDTPINTIYSATAPLVTEAAVAPGAPVTNDSWFNTDEGQLYYWSVSDVWVPVKTIYWLNTDTNLFHYRTMYDRQNTTTIGDKTRVDTDWTQMFANPPGFADVQPAVPPDLNAHVTSWDSVPHRKTHTGVYTLLEYYGLITDPALIAEDYGLITDLATIIIDYGFVADPPINPLYAIPGGNYIHRFGPETRLEMYDNETHGYGFIEFTYPESFEIYDVDFVENELRIPGVVHWLFRPGRIMGVRIWNDTYHEVVVVDSSPVIPPDYEFIVDPVTETEDYGLVTTAPTVFEDYGSIVDTATETMIELAPSDIALFQGLTTTFGTIHGAAFEPPFFSWAEDKDYRVDQIVKNNFEYWICILDHISDGPGDDINEPGTGTMYTTYWSSYALHPNWDYNTAYLDGDIVNSGSKFWVCLLPHTSDVDDGNPLTDVNRPPDDSNPGDIYAGAPQYPIYWRESEIVPKTYLVPASGTIYPSVDTIAYSYVLPQKIHTLTTDATIKENFMIDWGSAYAWAIVATDSGAGEITVYSDISEFLDTTNKLFITQSQGIDGQYEITSYVVNVTGTGPKDTETVITLNPAPPTDPAGGHFGFAQIEDSEVVSWFQFTVISSNSTTNEFTVNGDVTLDIPNGGSFRVVGTLNDGTYTATAAPIYDGFLDQSTIQVASIAITDTGGWVEHV